MQSFFDQGPSEDQLMESLLSAIQIFEGCALLQAMSEANPQKRAAVTLGMQFDDWKPRPVSPETHAQVVEIFGEALAKATPLMAADYGLSDSEETPG